MCCIMINRDQHMAQDTKIRALLLFYSILRCMKWMFQNGGSL